MLIFENSFVVLDAEPGLARMSVLAAAYEAVLADAQNYFVVTNTSGALDALGFIRTQLTN
jgi:hypothetical protein